VQKKFSAKFCFSRYQSVYKNCNPKSELEGACDPIRGREDLFKLIVLPFLHTWNELGFKEFGRGYRLPMWRSITHSLWKKLSPKLRQLVKDWFARKMGVDEVAPSFLQLDGRSFLQLDGPSFLQMDAGESSQAHVPEGEHVTIPEGDRRLEHSGSESGSSESSESIQSVRSSDSGSSSSPASSRSSSPDDHSPHDSADDHSPPDSPDDRSPSNSPDFSQSPNEEVDNDGSAIGTAQERVQQHGGAENFQELEAPEIIIHATDGRQANRNAEQRPSPGENRSDASVDAPVEPVPVGLLPSQIVSHSEALMAEVSSFLSVPKTLGLVHKLNRRSRERGELVR
jgi:hypothetical protein